MPTEVTITISSTDGGASRAEVLDNDNLGTAATPLPIEELGVPSGAAQTESAHGAPAPLPLDEVLDTTYEEAAAPAPFESPETEADGEASSPAPLDDIQPKSKKR